MATAKKQTFNGRSMSVEARNSAYGAINILWAKMRPDLAGEDKDTIRAERLAWIAQFLNLKGELKSTTKLSDSQIGLILEEMRRMTGDVKQQKPKARSLGIVQTVPGGGAEIVHLASSEQVYALDLLEKHLGWTVERREDYLMPRFRRRNFRTLTFDQATALTMQMLTIAAHKDLKAQGKTKISRAQIAKYIPTLKKKLGIDQK